MHYDGATEDGYDVAAAPDGKAWVVGAGAYVAKEAFKKDYSCFKAAMASLNDGTEIFGEYHDTIEGDNAYGICPLGGIMVDPTNCKDIMGPDAE